MVAELFRFGASPAARACSMMAAVASARRSLRAAGRSNCDGEELSAMAIGSSTKSQAAADERATWSAVTAFRAPTPASGGGRERPLGRPGRADLFHVRPLQVLDGLPAGVSQRELAIAIFASAAAGSRVAAGWRPSRSGAISHPQGTSADGRGIPSADCRRPDRFLLRQRSRAREQVGFP